MARGLHASGLLAALLALPAPAQRAAIPEQDPAPRLGAQSEAVDRPGGAGEPRPLGEDRTVGANPEPGSPKEGEEGVPGPALIRGWLAGTTTWRSRCLRPGVASCGAYDALPTRPPGDLVDLGPGVPSLGLAVSLELFPFAARPDRWLNGLGLTAHLGIGASVIQVVEQTTQGAGTPVRVNAVDLGWALALAWRVHFWLGAGSPRAVGFVGVRAGLRAQRFSVDSATTALPSSQRVAPFGLGFPELGVEASVPLAAWFRVDARASLLVSPRPSLEQIVAYGDPAAPGGGVSSAGLLLEGGASGRLWGPLGWAVRVGFLRFVDQFTGVGQRWPAPCAAAQACGGVGEETLTTLTWGLTGQL
jgi:hypothetical protein